MECSECERNVHAGHNWDCSRWSSTRRWSERRTRLPGNIAPLESAGGLYLWQLGDDRWERVRRARRFRIRVLRPACTCSPDAIVPWCARHSTADRGTVLLLTDTTGEYPDRVVSSIAEAFAWVEAVTA